MSVKEFVTTGLVEGGALKIRNRRELEAAFKKWPDGEVVVRIDRLHATRSTAQNRYWWAVCVDLVSDHTGYSPEEVHEIAKQMFLPKKLAVANGNGEIKGEFVIGGTTTSLNKIEFGEFVERYRQWAAETLGVVIPDPVPPF